MVVIEEEVSIKKDEEMARNHDVKSPAAESAEVESEKVSKDAAEGFETASEGDLSDKEGEHGDGNSVPEDEQKDVRDELVAPPKDDTSKEITVEDELKRQQALVQANDAKVEGNNLFKDGHYEDALLKYEGALQLAAEIPSAVELRSICHANRAACFQKLGKHQETVKECSKSLELNPGYMKVLVRRAEANEKLENYEDAIADNKKILELDPSNYQARRSIIRLEPLAKEKMEKMKEEMIGKLKDMGNTLLGKFGMSLDNFKVVKDPNSGSCSVQYQS